MKVAPESPTQEGLQIQIALVGRDLRRALTPILSAFGGADNPRPMRVARALGLDKSLASRLVQATRAESGAEFLHVAPSPTGLRILLSRAAGARRWTRCRASKAQPSANAGRASRARPRTRPTRSCSATAATR